MRIVWTIILMLGVLGGHAQYIDVYQSVNSKYDEQNPVLMPDGTHLFYTVANHPTNVGGKKDPGDIWYSIWQDSIWSIPIHAGDVINNKRWNGVIGFTASGDILLHHKYSNSQYGMSVAQRKGDGWSAPVTVEIPYFLNRSKLQSASLSPDGTVLIFSVESYGTLGAEDLYVCKKKNGTWSDLVNLGSELNTQFQELTPVIAADNEHLFFASNGHGGHGSMDIFKTSRLDDTWLNWSPPVNVAEVNTSGRELSFSYDASTKIARFITTQDSDGYGDIRFYEFKEPIADSAIVVQKVDTVAEVIDNGLALSISGLIKDKKSLLPINATINVAGPGVDKQIIANNGRFTILLDSIGDYQIKVSANGYLPQLNELKLDSVQISQNMEILLSSIVVGEAVTLENVLFEQGKSALLESSYKALDDVVELLRDNPNMEIELAGHTDNQGSSKLNMKLSKERVEVVKKYLTSKGIQSRRIEGEGYGGTRPIASNKNAESRKLNRRVEFVVVKE